MRGGSTALKLCKHAEKHFHVLTDDTRKILAVDDLKKEEVRRGLGRSLSANTPGATTVMASSVQRRLNLKSAVHAEILTLLNAEEDPIEGE